MKKLYEIFDIKKGDIVSITGSGGKSTLMFSLGKELKNLGRVLLTTSTKIRIPEQGQVDYLYKDFLDYKKLSEDRVLVCIGQALKGRNKLGEIGHPNLMKIKDDFDYILIEADGSRNLPLKMWKDTEPVLYDLTSKTIGVISLEVLGQKKDQSFIYNLEGFNEIFLEEYITEEVISKLVSKGMFRNFSKDKYLYLNKAKEEIDYKDLVDLIFKENSDLQKVVTGSLWEGVNNEYILYNNGIRLI